MTPPTMAASSGKPRSLTRRYAPDVAIILATFAFTVLAGLVGIWLVLSY